MPIQGYIGNMETEAAQTDEVFINSAIFKDGVESTEYSTHNVDWKRQHEIWRHGDGLISASSSQQDLQAAVMQLQRAVEQRDTLLQQLYCFTDIPHFPKSKQYVIMTDLGIIRPTLKRHLRELRNVIMHEVADIQLDKGQCEFLSDTAWYYLKATDRLTQQCVSELHPAYIGADDPHYTSLTMTFRPGSWVVNLAGNIPDDLLLAGKSKDCLSIRTEKARFEPYRGVRHFKFSGQITGSEVLFRRLVQMFFDESGL